MKFRDYLDTYNKTQDSVDRVKEWSFLKYERNISKEYHISKTIYQIRMKNIIESISKELLKAIEEDKK